MTGHRLLEGLRKYERTSNEQHQAVSEIMMSKQPVSFEKHMDASATLQSSVTANHSSVQDKVKNIFDNVSNYNIGNITINISSAAAGSKAD